MNLLRRLAAVGSLVTAIDVAILAALAAAGVAPVLADAAAIAAATAISFVLHRRLTVAGDPHFRLTRQPAAFATVAVVSAAFDLAVLASALAVAVEGEPSTAEVLLAKGAALVIAGGFRLAAYRAILFAVIRDEQDTPAQRPAPPGEVRVSLVIPAYRAAGEIGPTIQRVRSELADLADPTGGGLEVVVVDDGSGDGTAEEAAAAGADQVLHQPENRGKGAAVRRGVLAARGRSVVFTDADLSYSPDQVRAVVAQIEAGWDVAVGSRHHTEAVTLVRTGRLRELTGRVFNLLTAFVLLGRYRDTQCGLKAFRADVARLLFERSRVDGFAFDVEVLHLVERYGLSMVEVPVTLEARDASTVRVGIDALSMVRDLVRIRREAGAGTYDLGGALPLPSGRPAADR